MSDPSSPRAATRSRLRLGVVAASVVVGAAGSLVLATREADEAVTTEGVRATLQVASHPGWVAAGRDAVWLALNSDPKRTLGEKPLLRLDLATGVVEQNVSVGGEASFVARSGNRLIASVRHVGQDELGGRRLIAVDWRSGATLVRRAFDGPVDHVVPSGRYLWALELRPGVLLRLDPRTLAPTAPPLALSPGRTLDLASGARSLWVTAADAGELLRVDPATRAVRRVHVGGHPVGVVVVGTSVWYADQEHGDVIRRDTRRLDAIGSTVHVGGKPTWLAAAGGSVFVSDAATGTVSRIDARSGRRAGLPIRIATPDDVAAAFPLAALGNSVWVSSSATNTLTRLSSPSARSPSRTIVSSGLDASEGAVGGLPPGGRVVATIEVPIDGSAFTAGEGAVWALSATSSALMRIDPKTNSVVARTELPAPGEDAVAGNGAVWVSHPARNTLSRIDPSTNDVVATIHVGPKPSGLALSPGAIWVANIGEPSVSRIDPKTNRVVATVRVAPPRACCAEHMSVTARPDAVWVAVPNDNALVRIDAATNTVTSKVKLPSSPCAFLAADDDAVWGAGGGCGDFLVRVDTRTNRLTTIVQGEPHPVGLALHGGSLWVAALRSFSIDRIAPETGRVTASLRVGGLPVRVAAGFGAIWVYDDGGRVLRIEPQG